MDSSPSPTPVPQLPPKRGGCCCAGGCATLLTIGVIGLVLLVCLAWYASVKAIGAYTSSTPVDIRIEEPSDAQFAAANAKVEQLRAAAEQNQAGAFEFTAADLNALIARHPKFKELRNKVHIDMESSTMLLDVSAPLSSVSLPGLSKRYFNGTAKLGLEYNDGSFDFALRSLTASGRDIPLSVLPGLDTTFDQTFNESFQKSRQGNRADEEMWEHVQSVKVVGDKLVVTTKGGEVTSAR